jgi:hypothetical protein
MEAEVDKAQESAVLVIEASPAGVDAAAELHLKGKLSFTPPRDLRGKSLLFKDQAGEPVGSAVFVAFDGEVNETDELVVTAPAEVGEFTWLAVLPAGEDEAGPYDEVTAPLVLAAQKHRTRLVVWDVPSAIVGGERFRIKVGAKCSTACSMADRQVRIRDHDGREIAVATLTEGLWPGSALHFSEMELVAPSELGRYQWEATIAAADAEPAHEATSSSFGVRSVERGECVVTVTVHDAEKRTPLGRAKVVMHPYRTLTDECGVAELTVPRGSYRLFISASRYEPTDQEIEVAADLATTADLVREPPEDSSAPYR